MPHMWPRSGVARHCDRTHTGSPLLRTPRRNVGLQIDSAPANYGVMGWRITLVPIRRRLRVSWPESVPAVLISGRYGLLSTANGYGATRRMSCAADPLHKYANT
jgi:hypothetical protein